MENKIISNEAFLKAKNGTIGKDPLVKKTLLGNIDLRGLDKSIPTIGIDGIDLRVSNRFINSLANHLNIGGRLTKMFQDDIQAKAQLIRAIKSYAQTGKNGGKEILLLGGGDSKTIEDLTTSRNFGRITNETLFNFAEGLLNRYSNLGVESIDKGRGGNGGGLAINMILTEPIEFDDKSFTDKEVYNFGLTLNSTFTTTEISDYNMRLVCSNGMISKDQGMRTIIKNIKEIDKLYDRVHSAKGKQFIPPTFKENLILCNKTHASLAEVEKAYDLMSRMIKEEDSNIHRQFRDTMKANFFQGIGMTEKRLQVKGFDMKELMPEDKSLIKTPMKVWEVINSVTTLASNNHGFPMLEEASLIGKLEAGNRLMGKDAPDLAKVSKMKELISL